MRLLILLILFGYCCSAQSGFTQDDSLKKITSDSIGVDLSKHGAIRIVFLQQSSFLGISVDQEVIKNEHMMICVSLGLGSIPFGNDCFVNSTVKLPERHWVTPVLGLGSTLQLKSFTANTAPGSLEGVGFSGLFGVEFRFLKRMSTQIYYSPLTVLADGEFSESYPFFFGLNIGARLW